MTVHMALNMAGGRRRPSMNMARRLNMGRPKADEQGAPEKMQHTFWRLLEAKPYAQINVSDITRASGLNRSAFYYHYTSIPELADDAIASLYAESNVAAFIVHLIRQPDDMDAISDYGKRLTDPEYLDCVHKLMLIAGPHGSAGLVRQLKNFVIDIWLSSIGVKPESLSPVQRITAEFAANGVLGMLSSVQGMLESKTFDPEWLSQSPVPRTVSQLVHSLREQ